MSSRTHRVSVVVPTYNEESSVGEVVDGIKSCMKECEILVVDGGSEDHTVRIAESKGAKVLELGERGKGLACRKGVEVAKGEIVVFIDGDGSYPADYIPALVAPIARGEAEMVRGSRFIRRPHIPALRYVGNKFFTAIASLLHSRTTDLLTGMCALRKDVLLKMDLESQNFEFETELFVKADHFGLRVKEIPVPYFGRKGSKLSPLKDGLKILLTILKAPKRGKVRS